ncbi:MAG: glycosyltransferase, partial [Gammaproteobacteria bacterium]|nr:glycosyltransferase [Gammaproteobacteria bacterium]
MDNNDSIRVLHIVSGDLWAGAEVQFYTLAKALRNIESMQLDVILLNHGTLEQKLRSKGINVVVHDESEYNGFQILQKLVSSIRKARPDIVHTHRIKENILGSIAALTTGSPALRTAHGAPEHSFGWTQLLKKSFVFIDWFCGRFLQKKTIAVSEDLAKILQRSFPANRITVIENGIDIDAFNNLAYDASTSRNNTSIDLKIGLVGRLVPVKRIDIFIMVAQYMMLNRPDISCSFHIFGDGPMLEDLQRLSNELHTENIVHFEGHRDDIHWQLKNLDYLLMP